MFCFSIVMYFPGVQIIYHNYGIGIQTKIHIYIHLQADLVQFTTCKAKIPQKKIEFVFLHLYFPTTTPIQ